MCIHWSISIHILLGRSRTKPTSYPLQLLLIGISVYGVKVCPTM